MSTTTRWPVPAHNTRGLRSASMVIQALSPADTTKTLEATIASLAAVTADFVRDKRVFAVAVASLGAVTPNFVRDKRVFAVTVASTGAVSAALGPIRGIAATIASQASLVAAFVRDKRVFGTTIGSLASVAADITVTGGGAVVRKLRTIMGVGV